MFKTNKRKLTIEEKYERVFQYYGMLNRINIEYDDFNFDEEDIVPKVKIKENLEKFDSETQKEIEKCIKQDMYEETIDFKCLKCNYEENDIDYETIAEIWDEDFGDYPILYCPNCNKDKFVPIDIWNKVNKK